MLSNFYIPAYLYGSYSFYELAVFEETTESWAALVIFTILSYISLLIHWNVGTSAQYFLSAPVDFEDSYLIPSLFYILNWVEHEPNRGSRYDPYGDYYY